MSNEANNAEETDVAMSRMGRGTKNVAAANENEKIITPEYQMKHNHLLVIAVDHYHDEQIPDLKNCLNDIEDLLEILTTHYFFNRDNVRFLRSRMATNAEAQAENEAREISYAAMVAEATHDNIIAQLKELAKTLTPEDNLIICFSGHGIYDEDFDEGYWIPSDGRLDYNSSYIENGTIRTALNAMDTHHTVLISDSCYSGTLFAGGQTRSLTVPRIYFQPSRWGVTAGRKEPVSDGTLGDNSPFAKELLDILRQKREIWIADLINEIIKRVTDENNEKQSPAGEALSFIKGHKNGQFVFLPRMATEEDYWEMAWQDNTRKGYYAFLARYPNGSYEEIALNALNVFATGENHQPAFSEEALSTYRLLQKYLPEEARSYVESYLIGETRSLIAADAREMYDDLMTHFPKHIERQLKSFVLLGENASNLEDLIHKYQEVKGEEEKLINKFKYAFVERVKGNPYRGLETYDKRSSQSFLGRKAITYKVVDQLKANRLVIISAPAYAGKTSLVQAGIFPVLKKEDENYEWVELEAGAHPSSYKHHKRVLEGSAWAKDRKKLLFIDDYEKLFARATSEKEREALQQVIVKLVEEANSNWFIVICLKSDFEKQLRQSLLSEALNIDDYLFRLPAMNQNELRKVLLGPMWSTSVEYESPELLETIIRDVEHVPNVLPLLSLSLQELYNRAVRDGSKVVKEQVYGDVVSVHTAIDAIAEQDFKEDEHLLKKIFIRMLEPVGYGEYRGRRVWDDEYSHLNSAVADAISEVLWGLDGSSLVDVIKDEGKFAGIEPKGLLITNWSRLQQWADDFGYENIVLQRELTEVARDKNLWDKDPRLDKVIRHIMAESDALVKNNDPYLMELLTVVIDELEEQDVIVFSEFMSDWQTSEEIPTLDDVILIGAASRSLLEALIQASEHWLSEYEALCILESWDKKVQDFVGLKQERDEALAAKKQAEELLYKSIIQTQAFKTKYQEQTHKDLLFIQKGFKPNLHLILVGIDDYPRSNKLRGCVADVEAIAKAFTSQEGKLYQQVFLHTLTNEQATKQHILERVDEVRKAAGILDFVFVYLSGNSLQIPDKEKAAKKAMGAGFITYSPQFKEVNILSELLHHSDGKYLENSTSDAIVLPGRELCTALLQFKSKVILTIDIPWGGEFLNTLIEANHSDDPNRLSNYVFALSACSHGEVANEMPIEGKVRGAFSYALTNSITTNEADLDSNGVLYLDELLLYTSKVVKERAEKQNVLAVVPPIMSNIPLFQLGDHFALPKAELALSGHITDDAVIKSINTIFGISQGPTR